MPSSEIGLATPSVAHSLRDSQWHACRRGCMHAPPPLSPPRRTGLDLEAFPPLSQHEGVGSRCARYVPPLPPACKVGPPRPSRPTCAWVCSVRSNPSMYMHTQRWAYEGPPPPAFMSRPLGPVPPARLPTSPPPLPPTWLLQADGLPQHVGATGEQLQGGWSGEGTG